MDAEELVRRYEAGERDFRGEELPRANLIRAHIPRINLSGAYLYGANLSGACLDDAILEGVNLERAWLCGLYVNGELRWADPRQSDSLRNFLRRARHDDVMKFKPGTSLRNAVLKNANLQHAVLWGADLSGADLKGAIVTDKQLAEAESLQVATMPDGTKHE
jgi:uncharacterized protein YjbI with pentapeptide repeats